MIIPIGFHIKTILDNFGKSSFRPRIKFLWQGFSSQVGQSAKIIPGGAIRQSAIIRRRNQGSTLTDEESDLHDKTAIFSNESPNFYDVTPSSSDVDPLSFDITPNLGDGSSFFHQKGSNSSCKGLSLDIIDSNSTKREGVENCWHAVWVWKGLHPKKKMPSIKKGIRKFSIVRIIRIVRIRIGFIIRSPISIRVTSIRPSVIRAAPISSPATASWSRPTSRPLGIINRQIDNLPGI